MVQQLTPGGERSAMMDMAEAKEGWQQRRWCSVPCDGSNVYTRMTLSEGGGGGGFRSDPYKKRGEGSGVRLDLIQKRGGCCPLLA